MIFMAEQIQSLDGEAERSAAAKSAARLADESRQRAFSVIRGLKEQGIPVIIISHNLRQVFNLVDRIWVFRQGRIVGHKKTIETEPNEIVSMITGLDQGVHDNASYI
jgi:fructose transport system ATP-binding protein